VQDVTVQDLQARAGVGGERAPRAPHLGRAEFHTHVGAKLRRRGPRGRPRPPARVHGVRGEQPGREQALPAAEVQDVVTPGQQPLGEQGAERRVAGELAAREAPGELARRAIVGARGGDERGEGSGLRVHALTPQPRRRRRR
jgi:hypothetical protein